MLGALTLALAMSGAGLSGAHAETMSGALARAYAQSPDLNAQRAAARATDENLPRAMAAYRPTVTGTLDAGTADLRNHTPSRVASINTDVHTSPRGGSLSVTQTLYNGNRNANGVRQSESQINQAREQLRLSELTLLNSTATAYMNVLRDTAILNLRRNNIQVLETQLKTTQDRFKVGEVTRTDVAQSESALAVGQSDAFTAQSNLQNSIATFRQLVGVQPKDLAPAKPVDNLLPRSLDEAIAFAQREHPSIQAALHNADIAEYAVKIAEGQLYPTLSVTGLLQKRWDNQNVRDAMTLTASGVATLSVPIYEGGAVYAAVRQAKEQFGQARLQADSARETVRQAVVSSWNAWQNARLVIQAQEAAVRAAEIALNGVREEAKVGQRTTLDVLNSQQTLLNTRVNLVTAQRDRVVNSYAVLAAIGKLSAASLGLNVAAYDPTIHTDQVKDKWIGVRTPDGR